jgi:hypothetical protein
MFLSSIFLSANTSTLPSEQSLSPPQKRKRGSCVESRRRPCPAWKDQPVSTHRIDRNRVVGSGGVQREPDLAGRHST